MTLSVRNIPSILSFSMSGRAAGKMPWDLADKMIPSVPKQGNPKLAEAFRAARSSRITPQLGLDKASVNTADSPDPSPKFAIVMGIGIMGSTCSHFALASAWTLGSVIPPREISSAASCGMTILGPSNFRSSSCPTFPNKMIGDALTTHCETTADLLVQLLRINRE